MSEWLESNRALFREILNLPVGVAQIANYRLMELLQSVADISVLSFESGSEFNGWVVPKHCHVETAKISSNGTLLFDGLSHPLAVIAGSKSFVGSVDKETLDQHVFFSKAEPDSFAFHCTNNYRPWATDWGFCVPWSRYRQWPQGSYDVDLQTTFEPSAMLVGIYDLPGDSEDTIVLNAHTCHPLQFEDGFSGVAAILEVMEWLARQTTRRYTYRAVFAPEHIGTVFYLQSLKSSQRKKMRAAVFTEMIGLDQPLAVQQSFSGKHGIDRIACKLAQELEPGCRIGEFRSIVGNDETVWEAPGYEIPCISISRCFQSPFYYSGYHTSSDTMDNSNFRRRSGAIQLIKEIVSVFETDMIPQRRFEGLVALSNPSYDLYVPRPDPTVPAELSETQIRLGAAQDKVLRYLDGNFSIFEISEILGLPFEILLKYLHGFHEKGLVELTQPSMTNSLLTK